MKNVLLCFVLLLSFSFIHAQSFAEISTGDFVNSGTSLSTNWGDVNNDGWNDLFYTGGSGPRLYINNGDGTFTTETGGDLTNFGNGISGTWGDFDRDGFIDLFKASPTLGTKLFKNNGDGTFTKLDVDPFQSDSSDFQGNAWADYDNDGHLDLFLAVGGNIGNLPNRLYHNNGDGTFETIEDSPIVTDLGGTVDGAWADYNNDGFVDLYVVNSAGNPGEIANFLYKNNGDGTFTNVTQGIMATDQLISLGASWGDFDNDGDFDLFVAGLGEPNAYYQNDGNDSFTKITTGPHVDNTLNTIGTTTGDVDNDGDLDIVVVNFTQNQIFLNNGDGTFTELTNDPFVDQNQASFGTSLCDYDHDGDLDISVSNIGAVNNSFFTNNGNSNHWINIKCVGTVSNLDAIGTKVKVKATIDGQSVWQLRHVQAQTGVLSQNSMNVEFGLGDATIIDSLIIEWPSGIVFDTANVAVDQYNTQIEHLTVGTTQPGLPFGYELHQNYPNPFINQTQISYTLPEPTNITLEVFDQQGSSVILAKDWPQSAGTHTFQFDASDFPPGVYYATLRVKAGAATLKMIIID